MKPYENTQESCIYGHFDPEIPAGYTLTDRSKLVSPWYYIYNNRKILLYVDQNGPVKIQHLPPNGILLIKRETGETQSKWQVWVQSPDLNSGVPVSNFGEPSLRYDLKKPEFTVSWMPEKAVYTSRYDRADIITELFVPLDKATVCMKTTVVNKSDGDMDFTVTPALFPYINIPQPAPWDLPEWSLSTKVMRCHNMLTVHAQMNDPRMVKEYNRSVTLNMDYDEEADFELDMTKFAGSGNFFSPDAVKYGSQMTHRMCAWEGAGFGTKQSAYAARYSFTLKSGEERTFTQVLTVQEDVSYSQEENLAEKIYFSEDLYSECLDKVRSFYGELFGKRSIKTSNPLYDNFINYFTPLQMYWVCSLDRGWPSSMRGVRDASQDFMGMTHLDQQWTRQTILELFEHQRTDGWLPRQISTVSRTAPHDMRYFCDGGAFLLELIHEYMTFTRDADFLDMKVVWLDSDEESAVLEHILRCVDFYLSEDNIGEHGLCKVWYGDWWDVADKIGIDGRGESVTVTAQMVMNLKNLYDMFSWLCRLHRLDTRYMDLAADYMTARDKFIAAMRTHAYNAEGFFNGYFNDNGKWLFSDNDPDGEKRVYLVSNSWALISGCATKEMAERVIDNIERECFGRIGYNTRSKGFKVYVDKAGRVGNGTQPGAAPYNHAQSFLVRALCECGDAERAYKATRYILPIEETYAPVEDTYAPPYAIVNLYNNSDRFLRRAGFQFLSGTVSYVLRTVYSFFLGITYGYEGLILKPCIPECFGDCTASFSYLGSKFTINFVKTDRKDKTMTLNGRIWDTEVSETSGKTTAFIADCHMESENRIVFEY